VKEALEKLQKIKRTYQIQAEQSKASKLGRIFQGHRDRISSTRQVGLENAR
jgi:hypothetical protein